MRLVLYSVCVLLLGSCATMFNSKLTRVSLHSSSPATLVLGSDTVQGLRTRWDMDVKRSKEPLKLLLFNDSVSQKITVRSRNSFALFLNVYPGPTWIWGFLIDQKNPKRYTYPHHVFANLKDSLKPYRTFANERKKGDVLLHVSLPLLNHFYVSPYSEPTYAEGGCYGISLGVDYYYKPTRHLSLVGMTATDVPGIAFEYFGNYTIESAWSKFISLANNHDIGRLSLGYGLSYAENFWSKNHHSGDSLDPSFFIRKSTRSFGAVLQSYYKAGKYFYLGIIYKPSLYIISDHRQFVYEHLISLDLAWKIRVHKGSPRDLKQWAFY